MPNTNGWIVLPNYSETYERTVTTTDENGNPVEETVTDFGRPEWAYRRPGDHVVVFSGVSADDDPPEQSAQEALEASGFEPPQPDSVTAANEQTQAAQQQSTATPEQV